MATTSELVEARELFRNLTLRELRSKYKRSTLGWTWSLVNPLATMVIYSVVFQFVLKVPPDRGVPSGLENFPLFLLCGLLPWNFLATGMLGGMSAPLENSGLIKKVYFPREVLTASVVASWAVQFTIELVALLAVMLAVGNIAFPFLPGVVVVLLIQMMFVYGLGLGLGAANVYFRDVQHFVGIALQLWFYATPIVYPLSFVPERAHIFGAEIPFRRLYELNPMVRFIEAYRDLFYHLRYPPLVDIAYLLGASVLVLVIGRTIFLRLEPRFAEEL